MTDTTHDTVSPFEAVGLTPPRRLLRTAASVGLVIVALGIALAMTRDRPEANASVGHNHVSPAAGTAPVSLDADGARRIGVTYAAVTAGPMSINIRSMGQVVWDETRATAIAPKVDGWIERLHVDFTGQMVRQGQPLLEIYSPMLVTAQEELLVAARLARDVAGGSEEARRNADEMLASSRRRLQYWDIPASVIEQVERSGQVSRTITLRAASSGVVVEKLVVAGQRIMAGETLYRLADLSRVWVDGQVFEHDLALVRPGQRASVEIEAYPGERWTGLVTYVYPTVDVTTRTARVRLELANHDRRLKPGMFATIHVTSGFTQDVLSVPRSAVLESGERSIVFVRKPDGILEPRQVVTGVSTDDLVEIRNGLAAGDTVVASATFLVDAESNLRSALGGMAGMPGMDTPAPRPTPPPDDHAGHGSGSADATRKSPLRRGE